MTIDSLTDDEFEGHGIQLTIDRLTDDEFEDHCDIF
jgi:hypothetical protein